MRCTQASPRCRKEISSGCPARATHQRACVIRQTNTTLSAVPLRAPSMSQGRRLAPTPISPCNFSGLKPTSPASRRIRRTNSRGSKTTLPAMRSSPTPSSHARCVVSSPPVAGRTWAFAWNSSAISKNQGREPRRSMRSSPRLAIAPSRHHTNGRRHATNSRWTRTPM